jgi:hypothetical protein
MGEIASACGVCLTRRYNEAWLFMTTGPNYYNCILLHVIGARVVNSIRQQPEWIRFG